MSRVVGAVCVVAYAATVVVANWAVRRYGIVPVGFGLMAPAGVYAVGVAFTLRDVVHETLGRWAVVVAILVGAALSLFVSSALAVASAAAFLLSEGADFVVYDRLRSRRLVPALVVSNVVGLLVDSVVFLWLAFGSLAFFWGQVVGKAWMTVLAVALLLIWRRQRAVFPRHP